MNTERLVIKKGDDYQIVDGPNRAMLFDACEYAFSDSRLEFSFALKTNLFEIRNWRIWSISHEDGSGHSFNLRGICEVDHRLAPGGTLFKPVRFEAYYDTGKRTGTLIFTEDLHA